MPGVFHTQVLGQQAYRLVAGVSLRDRSRLTGPADDGGCADVGLFLSPREACKAAQEILGVAESKAGGTSHGKIGFDGRDHSCTSGHRWAICLRSATSTLA